MTHSEPIDAARYAETERQLARLLDTDRDLLLLQGEAILALEAAARGLGGPGVRALNLVSGPYGEALGSWLAAGGAAVEHVRGEFDRALDASVVREALQRTGADVVSLVHAEAATGVVNPLREIALAAREAGALLLVDAVASVGAEPLEIDELDLDLVMLGTQKTLAGPAGVCAVLVNDRAWQRIAANSVAPRESMLSLLDWKERWIDAGRTHVPGYVHEHEMRALIRALDRIRGDIGLRELIARHQRARAGVRAASRSLGLEPWVAADDQAASVATLVRPPASQTPQALADAAAPYLGRRDRGLIAAAPGPLGSSALRINHTGDWSQPEVVLVAVMALAGGLRRLGVRVDLEAAMNAAEREVLR